MLGININKNKKNIPNWLNIYNKFFSLMILFLDVVSPFPKFILIDNDKIIRSIHILDKNIIKISDNLLPKYLMLEKKYDLFNKINKFVVSTGPGSFTALRVGISFTYAMRIS